jgi:hypothetical protein
MGVHRHGTSSIQSQRRDKDVLLATIQVDRRTVA